MPASLILLLVLLLVALIPFHGLVTHDLVLKLELEFEKLNFFLVLLYLVLEVSDLSLLAASAENSGSHREILINVIHVSEGHVACSQLIHLLLEPLNLLNVLILLLG